MNTTKVRLYSEGALPINEALAGLVPMATDTEQEALTADIQVNGLREPIVTYKGAVVDGRCRMKALRLLKQPIMYKELDSALTQDEVAVYVKSVNTRRNLTKTQKIATACRASLQANNTKSLRVLADSWGISERALNSMRYIAKHEPKFLIELFNGNSVDIVYNGSKVTTDKVSTIAKAIKLNIEADSVVSKDMTTDWNPDSMITTEAGKQWYANEIGSATVNPVRYMIELANQLHRLKPNTPQ